MKKIFLHLKNREFFFLVKFILVLLFYIWHQQDVLVKLIQQICRDLFEFFGWRKFSNI